MLVTCTWTPNAKGLLSTALGECVMRFGDLGMHNSFLEQLPKMIPGYPSQPFRGCGDGMCVYIYSSCLPSPGLVSNMHGCVCVRVYACGYVCICVYVYERVCGRTCTWVHVCVCLQMRVHVHVRQPAHDYVVKAYVDEYVYADVYSYIHMYIYIYVYVRVCILYVYVPVYAYAYVYM